MSVHSVKIISGKKHFEISNMTFRVISLSFN